MEAKLAKVISGPNVPMVSLSLLVISSPKKDNLAVSEESWWVPPKSDD